MTGMVASARRSRSRVQRENARARAPARSAWARVCARKRAGTAKTEYARPV